MKPTIKYLWVYPEPREGSSVFLGLAEKHYNPEIVTKTVETSEIVRTEPDGTFETLNTIYKKDR